MESKDSGRKDLEKTDALALAKAEDKYYKGLSFREKEDKEGLFKIHCKFKDALIDLKNYSFGYLVAVSRNIVRYDVNKKPHSEQTCQFLIFREFGDFKALYDLMESEKRERRFFEIIRYETAEEGSHNQSCYNSRLFFDIELKEKLFSKDEFFHPEALQDLEQIIRETLAECYPGKEIPTLEFVWSECPRPDKASYHLVVKGILFDNFKEHYSKLYHAVVYNVMKSGKFSYIPEEKFKLGDVIDRKMLVNVQFRMVGCCKINSPPLRFLNPKHQLEDSLVNVQPALSCMFYEKTAFFLRDFKTDKQKEIDEFFEKQEKSYPISGEAPFVEKELLLEALHLLKSKIPWMDMFEAGDYWNNCLLYLKRANKDMPYNCPRCGMGEKGTGSHPNRPPYITIYNGFDVMFCCGKAKPRRIGQLEMPLEEAYKQIEASKQQPKKKEKDQAVVNAQRRENRKRLEGMVPSELKRFMEIFRSRGPKGISDFYIEQKAQGKIFSYGLKGSASIFIWMEREKIWTEIGNEHLMLFVGDTMQGFIHEKMEMIDNLVEKLRFEKASTMKALLEDDFKFLKERHREYDSPFAMNEIAKCLVPRVHDEKLFAQLNANPYVLPILGGKIINFQTFGIRDRVFTDYCLEEVPTNYTGKISPAFLKFISDIFLDDEEIIDFMRKIVGYSITGITKEQKLFICHGSGGNGKTRFLDLIANTFGKFYASADKGVLSNVEPGAANSSLFRIAGKRFVSIPETNRGESLNEDVLKRLTGGDRITCRALYKEEIEFKPRWHLWLATNSLPNTSNDYAIERRLVLIRFNARFIDIRQEKQKMAEQKMKLTRGQTINWEDMVLPPSVRAIDPDLDEKLASDEFRESMLTWAVSGAHDYLKEGLKYPKSVRDLMDAHMKQCDSVQSFLDEVCMVNIGDETFKYQSGELHKAYSSFCKEYGVVKKTIQELTQQLMSMGFEHKRTTNCNLWIGVKPIPRESGGGSLLYSN